MKYPRWKKPKYSERDDRYIRRRMLQYSPVESRAKIRQDREIAKVVEHFAQGLGDFGDETKINWLPIVLLAAVAFFVLRS